MPADKPGGDGVAAEGLKARILGSKKRIIIGLATLIVVLAGVMAFMLVSNRSSDDVDPNDGRAGANLSTDPEDLKSPIQTLKESAPAADTSQKEKAAYYSELAQLQGDSGDYKAAIASFEREENEANSAMPYEDYYIWAYYYERAGNKQAAIAKLQKALSLLPDTKGSATTYSKQEMTDIINRRIQELSS